MLPSTPRIPPDRWRHEFLWPLGAAVALAAGAALLGSVAGWGPSAFWGIAVLAGGFGIALMARGAVMRAPRASDRVSSSVEANGSEVGLDRPAARGLGLHPRLVIALAGPTASNKTAIAEHAVANHGGWAWASCGAYVRSVARERGLATDLLSTHDFGQQLVDQMGAGAFLDAVIQHADLPSQVDTLVIDDIYHLEVFDALKERWDDLRFVSIDLPEPLRRRMMMEDRHLSAAQIAQVERTPLALAANRLLARHRSDMLHLSAGTVEQVSELSDKLFALASTA